MGQTAQLTCHNPQKVISESAGCVQHFTLVESWPEGRSVLGKGSQATGMNTALKNLSSKDSEYSSRSNMCQVYIFSTVFSKYVPKLKHRKNVFRRYERDCIVCVCVRGCMFSPWSVDFLQVKKVLKRINVTENEQVKEIEIVRCETIPVLILFSIFCCISRWCLFWRKPTL